MPRNSSPQTPKNRNPRLRADTGSLEAQAGKQAAAKLRAGLGSDTPYMNAMRAKMSQEMLKNEQQQVGSGDAGVDADFAAVPQLAAAAPAQQQAPPAAVSGSGAPNVQEAKAEANPLLARMFA